MGVMNSRLSIILVLLFAASSWTSGQTDQNASTADTRITTKQQETHAGGKDDLDAIGNRKIGGKGFGNWYSLEREIALGREYARSIDSSLKLLNDPVVLEYINRLGQNLVRNSDVKVPFTIKIIDSDEINAFALPGGFMYVNSGLILAAEDEAQLAGVMAHEIAHVAARHATRQMTRSNLMSLASIPLIFVGGGVGYAIQAAAKIAVPLSMTKFSRTFEAEADYLGLEYLYKTGYDPQAFLSFFERVDAQEKKKPGKFTMALSTHPPTADRIKKTQDEISRILPARDLYVVSTSDFDDARARLRSIENRGLEGQRDHKEPTLRRSADPSRGGNTDSTADDERPTLKRPNE
jgi:predicted Zn-dependent protease